MPTLIAIVGIVFIVMFAYYIITHNFPRAVNDLQPTDNLVHATTKTFDYVGLPIRLKIPQISVDAVIDPMGITAKGELQSPSTPFTVGWYRGGPRPGDVGSAVIDGHYGPWNKFQSSVFDNLSSLEKGDVISVIDENEQIYTFIVRTLQVYGADTDATSIFASSDGKSHLNLITCVGEWNKETQSYPERLIVFADKQ